MVTLLAGDCCENGGLARVIRNMSFVNLPKCERASHYKAPEIWALEFGLVQQLPSQRLMPQEPMPR